VREVIQETIDFSNSIIATGPQTYPVRSCPSQSLSFDWKQSQIILEPVQMTGAYIDNETGELVIGQDGSLTRDDDVVIRIPADHIDKFIDRLCDVIGIPSAKP
jgi:hypothetical protein